METSLKKSEGIYSLQPITTSVTQAFLPALCTFHILVFNKVSRSFIAYTNTVLISAGQFTVRFWKRSEVTDASKCRGGLLQFDHERYHELSKRRQPLTLRHGASAESALNYIKNQQEATLVVFKVLLTVHHAFVHQVGQLPRIIRQYCLLVTARSFYMTQCSRQPTLDVLTGYTSPRHMTCISGCYYSFQYS